jgi:hypothetical protein
MRDDTERKKRTRPEISKLPVLGAPGSTGVCNISRSRTELLASQTWLLSGVPRAGGLGAVRDGANQRFFVAIRWSSGLRVRNSPIGSMPAVAGTLSTVTVKSVLS